jgi:arylsulfatase A-like enzyme
MSQMKILLRIFALTWCIMAFASCERQPEQTRPNIILLMTADQGWGQTGYYDHPVLKTPHLDAMAENGLRLDRFYACAPVCSPTRASVLNGRNHHRSGVPTPGHALRLQEKTLAQALKSAGYATGHFGKWHLNALRGPGVPIFRDDPHGPGVFGFDRWVSVTNFFEMDPESQAHYGELVAFDRSVGILRKALRDMEVDENTLVWYCSDNGGLPHIEPTTTGD